MLYLCSVKRIALRMLNAAQPQQRNYDTPVSMITVSPPT